MQTNYSHHANYESISNEVFEVDSSSSFIENVALHQTIISSTEKATDPLALYRSRSLLLCIGSLLICTIFLGIHGTIQIPLNKQFSPSKRSICSKLYELTGPYMYVTLHSGEGILKYSIPGACFITDKVLNGGTLDNVQLRSMFIGEFNNTEALIVADSTTKNSRVLLYGECNPPSTNEKYLKDAKKSSQLLGQRTYIMDVIDEVGFPYSKRKGATHPYGVAQDKNGYIYASFQDTNSVLRFKYDSSGPYVDEYNNLDQVPGSFIPVQSPPSLTDRNRQGNMWPSDGTWRFIQLLLHHDLTNFYLLCRL